MERNYQYRPVLFFLMAYIVTWIPWSFGVYVGSQKGLEVYAALFDLIGLIGAALFLVLTSGSKSLKSDFKDRLFNLRRIRLIYTIVAIVMPFAVIGLSIWLSLWFGQSTDQFPAFRGRQPIGHDHSRRGARANHGGDGLWCGQSQSQDRNDEGDAAVRHAIVGVARAPFSDRWNLSEPTGGDG
jgi:hypothetical protein